MTFGLREASVALLGYLRPVLIIFYMEYFVLALFDGLLRGNRQKVSSRVKPHYLESHISSKLQSSNMPDFIDFKHVEDIPVGDFRFIAFDVETACGDAASICQIGLACVKSDNSIETFSMLVDPKTNFNSFNVKLHGIRPENVVGASCFPEALSLILPLLSKHHLIQHSSFDKRAIAAACLSYDLNPPDLCWSDSVAIARKAWPELKGNGGHGLANLKRKLDLNFQHHDAGEDARAAAMVVLHAEAHLEMSYDKLILPLSKK